MAVVIKQLKQRETITKDNIRKFYLIRIIRFLSHHATIVNEIHFTIFERILELVLIIDWLSSQI